MTSVAACARARSARAGCRVGHWPLSKTFGCLITRGRGVCSIGAGCSHLARCLAGPALVCVRERAHLTKAKQPRNLGYMQLAVLEVTNRQVATQVLKYFSKVQPFLRELSCERPLAHSQTASDVFHEHFSVRKHRRDCVLNLRAQLARIISSIG